MPFFACSPSVLMLCVCSHNRSFGFARLYFRATTARQARQPTTVVPPANTQAVQAAAAPTALGGSFRTLYPRQAARLAPRYTRSPCACHTKGVYATFFKPTVFATATTQICGAASRAGILLSRCCRDVHGLRTWKVLRG